MDFVSTVINSGLDAFTNLYDIEFSLPTDLLTRIQSKVEALNATQITDLLKIRVGDFNPPQPRIAQYPTDYKTIQVFRMAPRVDFERKFDLTFRIDSNYIAYHVLKGWSFLCHDPIQGGINLPVGEETELLGAVDAIAYAPNTMEEIARWSYKNVFCSKVIEPNYTRAGTEAVVATASFMFFKYLPPEDAPATMIPGTLIE